MKKYIFSCFLITALFFQPAKAGEGASLVLSQLKEEYRVGEKIILDIYADPGGAQVDAIRVNMDYSPQVLEIINVARSNSFNVQAGGNVLNNETGKFSFGAGVPGGTKNPVRFLSITFEAKSPGEAKISLNPSSLILSDGEKSGGAAGKEIKLNLLLPAGRETPEIASLPEKAPSDSSRSSDALAEKPVFSASNIVFENALAEKEVKGERIDLARITGSDAPAAEKFTQSISELASSRPNYPIMYWLGPIASLLGLIALASWHLLKRREI